MNDSRWRQRRASACFALLGILAGAAPAFGHGDVMRIGSTQANGGQLRIEPGFQFELPVYLPSFAGSTIFYTWMIPSFAWIVSAGDLFPLKADTTVRLTVQSPIGAEASMRLNLQTLDAPGENAGIGTVSTDPEDHVHPDWQLLLDEGVSGAYPISFKLTTSAAGYTESPVYTLMLTNIEPQATPTSTVTPTVGDSPTPTETAAVAPTATATEPQSTPTPTPTPTATATPVGITCPGDCDGDGTVSVDELVVAVGLAMTSAGSCSAADGNGDGQVTVDELVLAVSSALDGCASE